MLRLSAILRFTIREVHDQTRSHRFMVLTAVAAILTPLIMYVGVRDYTTRHLQFRLLLQQRALAEALPGGARVMGRQLEPTLRVIRSPTASSVLVRGVSGTLPRFWDVAPDGLRAGAGGDATARTPQSGVSLDLEFLIRIVLGLLAVSLATGALATERASGTLYMLLSQPIRAPEVLLAKLLGGIVTLGLALTVVMTGAAAALGVFGPELWSRDIELTMLGLAGVGLIYLSALYALGLVIGAAAASVSAANVAAMSVWVVVAVASVPTVDFMARVIAPVAASEAIESQRQTDFEARRRNIEMSLGSGFLALAGPAYRQFTMSDPVRAQIAKDWLAGAQDTRQSVDARDAAIAAATSHQRRVWELLSWCSPAGAFFDTASRLAGTGLPAAEHWDDTTRQYQAFLNTQLFDHPPRVILLIPTNPGLGIVPVDLHPAPEAAALQRVMHPETDLRTVAGDASRPLVVLLGYLVGLVILAFAVFPKIRY